MTPGVETTVRRRGGPKRSDRFMGVLAGIVLPVLFQGHGLSPTVRIARMQEALHHMDYVGRYVFVSPPLLAAFAVRHASSWELVTALNGPEHVVARFRGWTGIETPDHHWIRLGAEPWYTALPPGGRGPVVHDLGRFYRMRLMGWTRVAGRPARLLVVAPRDEYRYGYRFWIARHSNFPLRTILVSPRGRVLEEMMFVDVSFPTHLRTPRLLQWLGRRGPAKGEGRILPAPPPPVPDCRLFWLPPGFRVISDEVIPEGRRHEPTRHLLLSDGLASFSIFVRRLVAGSPPPLLGADALGPVSAYGRVLGSYAVTVVGDVPPVTVRLTADHVVLVPPPAP